MVLRWIWLLVLVLPLQGSNAQEKDDGQAASEEEQLKVEIKQSIAPKKMERTISNSNQFIIYGADKEARTALANRCEEIRRDLAEELQLTDKWKYNIIIQIYEPRRNAVVNTRVVSRIFPLEKESFRFQIDILRDERFRQEDFETELIKMLLLEQAYSPWNKNIVNDRIEPWMIVGLEQLIEFRRSGRRSDLYESLTHAHQIMTVREVMDADPRLLQDTLSKKVYRACAAALVQAMLDQNEGSKRFVVMLRDMAVDKEPVKELMKRHYAPFRQDDKAVAKWWALQMALMSQRTVFEVLSVEETERYLNQALRINLVNLPMPEEEPKGRGFSPFRFGKKNEKTEFETGTLNDFEQFLGDPRAPLALQGVQEQLIKLRNQVFPLYQPVVNGYLNLSSELMEGETKGVKDKLRQLNQMRDEIRGITAGVDDYMNWYATTQLQEETDAFEGYENALDFLDSLEMRKRTDPISRYMDEIERDLAP